MSEAKQAVQATPADVTPDEDEQAAEAVPAQGAARPALTASDIMSRVGKDRAARPVDVEDWGGTVYLRVMTGAERDGYINEGMRAQARNDYSGIKAKLLCRCLSDAGGSRLFADEDWRELQDLSGYVLDELADQALRLNGLAGDDPEADVVEELAGNSGSAPSDDSGTA